MLLRRVPRTATVILAPLLAGVVALPAQAAAVDAPAAAGAPAFTAETFCLADGGAGVQLDADVDATGYRVSFRVAADSGAVRSRTAVVTGTQLYWEDRDVRGLSAVEVFRPGTSATPSAAERVVTFARDTDVAGCVAEHTFADVTGGHPFVRDIEWLTEVGIGQGYGDGTFRPTAQVSRQAVAAFLYRYAFEPAFTPPARPTFADVPTSHPFYAEIEWLAAQGLATGWSDGTFRPGQPVSRQAMSAFLFRTETDQTFRPPAEATFADLPVHRESYTAVEWMAAAGVATGFSDGRFRPTDPVTRQAVAAFLVRADRNRC